MFVIIACLALGVQVAKAQYTIEDIRKSYASVKEYIAQMSGDHEHLWMYYSELEGSPIYPPHYLWFATRKYNYAVREYYEEYLYDRKGQIMFIYASNPDVIFGEIFEFRLYYDGQRLLKCIVKQRKWDEKNYREQWLCYS